MCVYIKKQKFKNSIDYLNIKNNRSRTITLGT